ncbi:hypothetical protein NO1_0223 [Candidatus Termititenax aidoneus]|uniref:Uncharacterized protein n=1 Tax=Termititenax aidoneus TaxID=2218524 RepID=A0A388T7X9_TERA1|nr:hypothetical protein NO1_0223 [Candidatus Termititenax aidoneus]
MTPKEIQRKSNAIVKKLLTDKKALQKYFLSTGIHNADGSLKKEFVA